MELTKYKNSEILAHIRHDLRQLPEGKTYGNESVDISISHEVNYSFIARGKTAKEVNQYRKDFEAELFKYNRKNLVHAIELSVQCPSDCPPEQHDAFFRTTYEWFKDYLPAGERCIFVAEVHRDEHKLAVGPDGVRDISKEHLHIAFVPAVPAGAKHPEYEYRLNADALTKRAVLRDLHPSLQKRLDEEGIQATVYAKKSSNGRTIPLTVAQLKELTDKTGIVLDHSLTVEELGGIFNKNIELQNTVKELQDKVKSLEVSAERNTERSWGTKSWGRDNSWSRNNNQTVEFGED